MCFALNWSIRWLMMIKMIKIKMMNCHMLITARRTDEGRDKNEKLYCSHSHHISRTL